MQRISKAELARRADKALGVKPLQEMEMEKRDTINYTATCEDVPKESVSRE